MVRRQEAAEDADSRLECVMPVIDIEVELGRDPLAGASILLFQPKELQRVQDIDNEAGEESLSVSLNSQRREMRRCRRTSQFRATRGWTRAG